MWFKEDDVFNVNNNMLWGKASRQSALYAQGTQKASTSVISTALNSNFIMFNYHIEKTLIPVKVYKSS